MQELEKILEEIDHEKDLRLKLGYDGWYLAGAVDMANAIKDIIRKHMNDGWIPVEERMLEETARAIQAETAGNMQVYRRIVLLADRSV